MSVVRLWCTLVITFCTISVFGRELNKKNILVLHSYNQGLLWTDNITEGINTVFEPHCDSVELHYEYLDTKRYPINDSLYIQQLLRFKKNLVSFDLVIAADNNALGFLKRHASSLFPETPIVFCGINDFSTSLIHGLKAVTGITEDPDHQSTLNLMMSLHPDKTKVVVFVDRTPTGNAIYRQLEAVVRRFQGQLTFEFLRDLSIENMDRKVSQVNDDSMIYLLSFNRDFNQKFISYKEVGRIMSENSRVPVYGCWEFYFGECIVGGKIISGKHQGEKAAEKALEIIQGGRVSEIPIDRHGGSLYMFDWNEMVKFGLVEDDLPDGAIIVNPPISLIQRYQTLFYTLLALSLSLILVLLIKNIRFRFKQHILIESNKNLDAAVSVKTGELRELLMEFKSIFNTSAIGIAEIDMDGTICKVNGRFTDILNWSDEALYGVKIFEVKGEGNFKDVVTRLASGDGNNASRYQDDVYVKRHGVDDIWCSVSALLFQSNDDQQKIILVIDDISERKRLEALKDDVTRIIQHDLKGSLLGIISLPQLLVSTGDWSDSQLEALETIESSGQRMLEMINSSLTIYKIETGSFSFIPQPTDIVDILRSVVTNYKTLADSNRVTINVTLNISDKEVFVKGDALLCCTVFENLLKNAIEASPCESVVEVTVDFDNMVIITIGNYGNVPVDIQGCFFDKYVSANKGAGTGLGTYSARLFTEAMEGCISLVNKPDYTKIIVKLNPYYM